VFSGKLLLFCLKCLGRFSISFVVDPISNVLNVVFLLVVLSNSLVSMGFSGFGFLFSLSWSFLSFSSALLFFSFSSFRLFLSSSSCLFLICLSLISFRETLSSGSELSFSGCLFLLISFSFGSGFRLFDSDFFFESAILPVFVFFWCDYSVFVGPYGYECSVGLSVSSK
jgi:hypothetical protein